VAQSLVVGFQWMSMLFLPLHFKALGVSDTGVGVLISVFSLSTLLLVLPLGILSDRLPPRPMMAAGAAVSGAAYMLAPGVQSVGWMVLVVVVAGAGFTLSSISLYSLFFKRVGADRRGAEVSLFNIGGLTGAGLAAWCGGELLEATGTTAVLWMGVALVMSGVFMVASGSASGVWDFAVYRIFHTAGDSVFNLLTLVVASIIFPRRRAGGAFAFALTVNTASFFLFANLGGLVGESFGFDRAFHLSGSIEVAGGLMLLVFRRRLRAIFMIERPEPAAIARRG